MTPRARELTTYAHLVRDIERDAINAGIPATVARITMKDQITARAEQLGFAPDEITSAVRNAIRAASAEATAS